MDNNPVYQTITSRQLTNNLRSLCLVAGGDGYVYQDYLNYQNLGAHWVITQERGDTFSIYSRTQQKYIARQANVDALILVGRDEVDNGLSALWRNEGDASGWHPINSATDWEQKINMHPPFGAGQIVFTHKWSGGDDNELWYLRPVIDKATIKSLSFTLDAASMDTETPVVAGNQVLTNNSGAPLNQTVHFQFTESRQYSFTQETGIKVSQSFEFKEKLPFAEATQKTSIETSFKFTEQTQTSDSDMIELDVAVTVPPYTAYEVSALVLRASMDVPYQAVVTYTSPDGSTTDVTTSGTYSSTNGYTFATNQREIGKLAKVERKPFNPHAATTASTPNGAINRELVSSN